jgi:hypothetical protein
MKRLPADTPALLFAHLVTLAVGAAAGWYTHTQGTDMPLRDEWYLIPEWQASESTLAWVMAPHNEHRFPLDKLVWLGVVRAAGDNFKAPMYGTVALMTAAAVLFQWAARAVRGRSHPLDALFPVLLLHWGNGFNLIWGYQIGYAMFVYGLAGWVWAAGRLTAGGGNGWGALSAVYLLVVVTTGGFGLAYSPFAVGWLGYLSVRGWRTGRRVWAVVFALSAVAVTAYAGWVFLTLPPATTPGLSPVADPVGFAAAIAGYLGVGVGEWHMFRWSTAVAVGLGAVVVYAAALVLAGWRAWRHPGGRRAVWVAVGLLLLGTLAVALTIARVRGTGVLDRFVTTSGAGLAGVVFVLVHRPPAGRVGIGVTAVGLAVGAALFWANHPVGLQMAHTIRTSLARVRRDAEAGYPPSVICGRNGGSYAVLIGDAMGPHLTAMRDYGWPQFRTAGPEAPVTPVPVPGVEVPFDLTCTGEQLAGGRQPVVEVPDPPPGAIALRVRATVVQTVGLQRLALEWKDAAGGPDGLAEADPAWAPQTTHLLFPLTGRPTALRLTPRTNLGQLKVEAVEWLVSPP